MTVSTATYAYLGYGAHANPDGQMAWLQPQLQIQAM